jgi:transcriptional regulator with XRE-family HTH domain
MNVIDKMNALSKGNTNSWVEEATYRQENVDWLRRSAHIALLVLRQLRVQGLSQKELATRMQLSPQYISKLLKGGENLSLQTISKLEEVLGITLIEVSASSSVVTNSFVDFRKPTLVPQYIASIVVANTKACEAVFSVSPAA